MTIQQNISHIIKKIWMGLILTPLFLMGFAHFIFFKSIEVDYSEKAVFVFMGVAILLAISAKVFFIKAQGSRENPKRVRAFICSWALAEMIAFIGLLLPIVCGTQASQYAYSFFITASILNYIHKPSFVS